MSEQVVPKQRAIKKNSSVNGAMLIKMNRVVNTLLDWFWKIFSDEGFFFNPSVTNNYNFHIFLIRKADITMKVVLHYLALSLEKVSTNLFLPFVVYESEMSKKRVGNLVSKFGR